MTPGLKSSPQRTDALAIDRVLRWCLVIFVASSVGLALVGWVALKADRLAVYLNVIGVLYVAMSLVFLAVIAFAFIAGHLGSSREIEAPKLEIFDIEGRQ